ncbi:MAG: Lpg1974 family pore-forming outer membrane protein [Gemmataceae bacterium]
MNRTTRPNRILLCLLLLVLVSASPALAQQAPAGPEAVLPPPPEGTVQQPAPIPDRGPFILAPAPQGEAVAAPGSLWCFDDWLDALPDHLFADVEVDILKPHLKAALIGPAIFPGGFQKTVAPPTTQVDWTAAPRFEVGWFLPQNFGYLAISYRGFADDGRQVETALDGTPYALRTRLDVNQIAFDYGTVPYSFAPRYYLSGRIGMAAANVYFDNVAVSAHQTLDASNEYYGAGPHVRLDAWREFNLLPGLALFAQPDLMVLVGRIQQHYRQSDSLVDTTVAGSYFLRRTQTVPVLTLRFGLSYTPPQLERWRFMAGYEFENWWQVGQAPQEPSRGEFYTNGVFLRAVVTF